MPSAKESLNLIYHGLNKREWPLLFQQVREWLAETEPVNPVPATPDWWCCKADYPNHEASCKNAPAAPAEIPTRSCNFCGNSAEELIPAAQGFICKECLAICAEMVGTPAEVSTPERTLWKLNEAMRESAEKEVTTLTTCLRDLMLAYERRIRSACTPEQLKLKPWRVAEYVAAEMALDTSPEPVASTPADKCARCGHGKYVNGDGFCGVLEQDGANEGDISRCGCKCVFSVPVGGEAEVHPLAIFDAGFGRDECPHLRQTFPGTAGNRCLDCAELLPVQDDQG